MIEGLGALVLANKDILYVGRINTFTLGRETEIKEARAYPFGGGPQQIVDSTLATETYTLTLGTASIDKLTISQMLNEIIQTSSTVSMPVATQGLIPSATTYTITVTGLTVNQSVQVSVISDTNPEYLKQVNTSPNKGEFQVTANTLTFNVADAGKAVVYHYMKSFTSVETLGVEASASSYGALQFSGIIKGTRLPDGTKIHLGKVKSKGAFELAVSDDTQIDTEYSVETPVGWRLPVRFMFPAAA